MGFKIRLKGFGALGLVRLRVYRITYGFWGLWV